MGAGFLGNDPASMRALSQALNKASQDLHGALTTLESQVQGVKWQGTDANQFKSNDWPDVKSKLNQVQQQLEQTKKTIDKQTKEQEQTSAH